MDSPKDTTKMEPEVDEIKPSESNKELEAVPEQKKKKRNT